MATPIIKARNIAKTYPDEEFQALKGVELTVMESEVLGIIGSSGSGKTTLLSILGLLEKPTEGILEVFGEDAGKMSDRRQSEIRLRWIGFIFQDHNLLPALTVTENIDLPLSLTSLKTSERKDRIAELLSSVGMNELADRYPSQLSRGQRQRIAAVRALANNPELILADEPTSDLDPENAKILLNILREQNSLKGTTVIIASTDLETVKDYTTRNMRIEAGRLLNL
jgi:ABC-type lipoprotein export system ATPase subunit